MTQMMPDTARSFAVTLLRHSGMDEDKATAMAGILVKAELMGHRTHGLAMLPMYLDRIASGAIRKAGEIEVLRDAPDGFAWEAGRLPGAWVMGQAMAKLMSRAAARPMVAATISNCSHIGSLQAYIEAPARAGYLTLMMVTDPGVASVAPFGGADPVLTTDPIACGIPTSGDPVLIDQCTSLVSNAQAQSIPSGMTELPGDWLMDNTGRPSRDPDVLKADPPGTIMPLGGADFGYKGFGFMLMCEAFALALSGYGRSTSKQRGAQGVFVQLIDPDAFGGRTRFLTEMDDLVARCHSSRPAIASSGVRLPGERAQRLERSQTAQGLDLSDVTIAALRQRAQQANIPFPSL